VQQRIAARGQAEPADEPCSGYTAEGEAHGREPVSQSRRPPRPGRGDAGQALGKDATLAPHIVTEEPTRLEPDGNAMLTPRQVGKPAFVSAVGALGLPAAQWARRRAGA
jgi:hypothetical protein